MRPFMSVAEPIERSAGKGLFIDNVSIEELLKYVNTPVFVTSMSAVQERANHFLKSIRKHFDKSEIFYAIKANSTKLILEEVSASGCGAEIVSIGEWKKAIDAGFNPKKISFAGPAKQSYEWKPVIEAGIGFIVMEHVAELEEVLDFIAKEKSGKVKTSVIVRINPCLEVDTHPHLETGAIHSKFGILFNHFKEWFEQKKHVLSPREQQSYFAPIQGLHIHIGSQIKQPDMVEKTIEYLFECANYLVLSGLNLNHIDLGGGMWVDYEHGSPKEGRDIYPYVDALAKKIKLTVKKYPELIKIWGDEAEKVRVCLEPGRSMVASSSILLTKVLYTKVNSPTVRFCYVDAGMNDFPRPSLYNAVHKIECVDYVRDPEKRKEDFLEHALTKWEIVGPLCESGDYLHKNALLPELLRGDTLAFFEAGAYCKSMGNEYNSRPLTKEVFVRNGDIFF